MPRSGSKKSGFLNIPARLLLKERDNSTGSYPTILRMGDKDRRGSYSTQFDDTNTIFFGRRIRDNFTLQDQDKVDGILGYTKKIDTNNWVQSGDLEIRKELYNEEGTTAQDGALVFAGTGDTEGRWLRTKVKIKNATVEADVIFGPYNESRTLLKYGLGLQSPGPTEDRGLKVQISATGLTGTWTTIKTLTGDVESLFGESIFSSRPAFETLLQKRKRVKIKLTPSDFSGVGGSEFYLRFAQTTVADSNQAEWAIGFVNIEYHNEDVRYPLMIDPTSRVGQRIATGAIANSHELPTLNAPGRSISGISDVHLKFTPGEGISAFDDARINITPEDYFFQQGSDPDVIPGMSSPLWSKTHFVVDLSPNEETTFGMTTPSKTEDESENETDNTIKQQLMVYWNKDLKRWEKIAQGISGNPSDSSLVDMITSGALGFSGVDMVSTGSTSAFVDQNVVSSDILNSYVRPTSTFGFPFEGKYHATGSQSIKARDIGISKPFVLEKCQISFDAKFEFGEDSSNTQNPNAEYAYSLLYGNSFSTPSGRTIDVQQRIYIPTFFILRQQDYDNFLTNILYDIDESGVLIENSRNVSIPDSNSKLSTDNVNETYVSTSRELISYGQITLFVSSSAGTPRFEIREALDRGLSRDSEVNILKINGQGGALGLSEDVAPVTGSFVINFPARAVGKIDGGSRMRARDGSGNLVGLWLDNKLGGRAYDNLDSSARSLVNGTPSLKKAGTYNTFATDPTNTPLILEVASADSSDLYSPYIIMPEDDIVFGWQYPMSNMIYDRSPGQGANKFHSMTLFRNSKLTLFGSQLQDNIEFHEGNNQNLGSDSVHEMIGGEPVVDQFRVARAIENYGNYLDSYIANNSEEPVNRVLSNVQSRLTTEKGDSSKGIATISYPPFIFGSKPGFNDGDRIAISDGTTIAHFYGFRACPVAPQNSLGSTPARYDGDDNGTAETSFLSLPPWGSDVYNNITGDFIYGLRWSASLGNNTYPKILSYNRFTTVPPAPAAPGPPGPSSGQVWSFKLEGGDYSGSIYTNDERKKTLENLLEAINQSALRMTGVVKYNALLTIYYLELTLLDSGTAAQDASSVLFRAADSLLDVAVLNRMQTNYDTVNVTSFSGANDLLEATLGSFVRVSPTQDAVRVYSDSLLTGSYGSFQTSGAAIRPKYYLDTIGYGQSIHLIEQGKDSKTNLSLKTKRSGLLDSSKGESLGSPVQIEFISGSTSDSLAVRGFRRTDSSLTSAVNKTRNSNLTGSFLD
jgi:hypothetical protein